MSVAWVVLFEGRVVWYTLDLDWVVVLQDGKTSVGGYWFCGLVVGKCCFSNNLAGNVLHVEPIRKPESKEEEPHYSWYYTLSSSKRTPQQ